MAENFMTPTLDDRDTKVLFRVIKPSAGAASQHLIVGCLSHSERRIEWTRLTTRNAFL